MWQDDHATRNGHPTADRLILDAAKAEGAPDTSAADLAAFYHEQYQSAAINVSTEVRLADPAWAENVLAKFNTRNRPLGTTWRKIKAAISKGHFLFSGETIVFARDGVLVDGQNRLRAIADGDVAVPVLVVRGVDPNAFVVHGQTTKRTKANVFSILGVLNSSQVAAALIWVVRYDIGNMHASLQLDNKQAVQLLQDHPGLAASAAWAKYNCPRNTLSPSTVAFLHYVMTARNPATAEGFLDKTVRGVGVVDDSHEFLLRRRLENLKGVHGEAAQRETIALFFKTWNRLVRKEAPRKMLAWRPDEEFPELD